MKFKRPFRNAVPLTAILLLACSFTLTNSDEPSTTQNPESGAQLFQGLGDWSREFTTTSADAHKFLVQGFIWLQSFNHDEAIRCFKEAARLDPDCAMAWWGVAYAEGPNYNDAKMTDERNQASWNALKKALERIKKAAPRERDMIKALAVRYEHPFPKDRADLEKAFADAMAELWNKYDADADIGAIYAEAMMVRRPWALYSLDREPLEDTELIVDTLKRVLELNPDHPGACHLYIHAVEQSKTPERALHVADRLCDLVPVSGHMLHMPSHIYTRVNEWDRSIRVNTRAVEADNRYRQLSPEQGIQHTYMIHNCHILAYSAMMVGRKDEALQAARAMWYLPEDQLRKVAPFIDHWMCSVYDVQKRFGLWDDLLNEPAPPDFLRLTAAQRWAHRAVAHAANQDFESANGAYAKFEKLYNDPPPEELRFPGWTEEMYQQRLDAIRHFVPGEIALQRGAYDLAIVHLKRAVEAEDKLGYGGEPPEYLQPIRHTLGAVYYKLKRYADAERTFWEDLDEFPGNGWSLAGLSETLRAQGKIEEADRVRRQYAIAWARADVRPLTTSCECMKNLWKIAL